MAPVNRTIIGMGSSGGFPGNENDELAERWNLEFGGAEGLSNKTRRCWVTNLEKHPVRLKLFPPVARPNDAVLKARVVLAKIITISSSLNGDDFRQEFSDFLESDFGWQGQGRFGPEQAPASVKPILTSRGDYFDLEIDLSHSQDFPVAYYAIVECGWSERGNHHLQKYRVTFEELKALKIQSRGELDDIEFENEWSLYYGVNGQWQAWSNNNVKKGESFSIDQAMEVWSIDSLPLLIRDAGVERDPGVAGVAITDEALDNVEFTIKGEDHLKWLRGHIPDPDDILDDDIDLIRFKVRGAHDAVTRHEWTIKIERIENIENA
ncbi:MAG: hypothetical protein L0220_31200, partial [Acidobacteria bacterium]|nr:hypothetical protein [Acidobacteriota bacterium]